MPQLDSFRTFCSCGRATRVNQIKPKWRLFLEYANFFFFTGLISVQVLPLLFGLSSSKDDGGWHAWDGEYFMRVKDRGYGFEKNHAFMPLMPLFMQYLPSHWLAYLLFRVVLNLLNLYLLMRLAEVFVGSTRYGHFILRSYIIQPGLVYLLSGYSESLYLTFALTGLLILERSKSTLALLTASMWFSMATLARSNGVLNLIFILYALIQRVFARSKPVSCCSIWRNIFLGLICYFIVIIPLFYVTSALPYEMYCLGRLKRGQTDLNPWCYQHIPNLYSWIQGQYWDVGILENFSHRPLADKWTSLPMYLYVTHILLQYLHQCASHFFTFGILHRESLFWKKWVAFLHQYQKLQLTQNEEGESKITLDKVSSSDYAEATSFHLYGTLKLLPYVLHFLFTMITSLFVGNFEINNRLATGCPMFYLALAQGQLQIQHMSLRQSSLPLLMKLSFLMVCIANLNLMPTNLAFL